MKLGICVGFDKIAQAAQLGFDYVEPPVNTLAALSEAGFEQKKAEFKALNVQTPCFNLLFPKTMALLDGATLSQMEEYLHLALGRVKALGGKIVVFGSGKSRNRPQAMPYTEAFLKLAELTRAAGEIAAEYGLTIVIEPLNRKETNMICSMAEGAALVASVSHANVKLLCDYYHVVSENEPLEDLARLGGVSHAHIASAHGRRFPLAKDNEQYGIFFAQLKASGYAGAMSIEGKTDDMAADAAVALALLGELKEEA